MDRAFILIGMENLQIISHGEEAALIFPDTLLAQLDLKVGDTLFWDDAETGPNVQLRRNSAVTLETGSSSAPA